MEWSVLEWTGIGAAIPIIGRLFFIALAQDIARRFSVTMIGIKVWDWVTRWPPLIDPIWSGTWKITWTTESPSFDQSNFWIGRVWRCFNTIAAEGTGKSSSGQRIKYGFVGKLSRDKTILTGTWFDKRGAGYHGCYQLRLFSAHNIAEGRWVGFSETSAAINADMLKWERLG